MYQHRIRRIGWSVFLLICAAFGGGVLWRLTFARQTPIPPRVAETVSPSAPQIQKKDEPEDLTAINADPGYNKRADASQLNRTATLPYSQQQHEEILVVGDPMRIVLPHSWIEKPLVVRTKPGSPVSFEALDTGKFANGKINITVEADQSGFAATTFYVGNEGEYRVLVSSPENDGPAEFIVQCVTRKFRDDLNSGRYAQQYFARERAAEKERAWAEARVEERIRRGGRVSK